VRVVDANVLLYAVNSDAAHHEDSREWLDRALGGGDVVGFTWVALLAFIRLSTSPRIFRAPLRPDEAIAQVEDWLASPSAHVLHPGERHPVILRSLLTELNTAGDIVNDAHLAAVALEHRGSIVSYDNDFARFPRVRWDRPDALFA
jgi:toxin-antitoxin system PIN domain toxin